MQLNQLADNGGARKPRMRVGRGMGCTKGKTCGRGVKGQKARNGVAINGFEGGQMPIHRRLPKRGFTNHSRVAFAVVNLGEVQAAIDAKKIDVSKVVDKQALVSAGLLRSNAENVKVLALGKVTSKFELSVCKVSAAAVQAIESVGGKIYQAA